VDRRTHWLALVCVLTLAATGCNSKLLRPPATIYVDGGETTVTPAVQQTAAYPAVFLSYFPSTVQLHAGDSVRFDIRYNGEPHTVAFGSLIDSALAGADKLGPQATVNAVEALPEMQKIPDVLPRVVGTGDPKVNRSAAEPCFLDSGLPANSPTGGTPPCAKRSQPAFDGRQSFYSSGFLSEGESFRVKLSSDIKPGTYRFMCLVHRTTMTGSIEIVRGSRPNVAQVKQAGRNEQRIVAASVTTAGTDAAKRPNEPIQAGAGEPGVIRGFVSAFVPDRITVHTGEPLTWQLFEMHSISFRPSRQSRAGLVRRERNGDVKLNLDAWRAVGSPQPPPAAFAYPPPAKPVAVDGGTWSGDGVFSSGVLRASPPGTVTYTLRFSKPGTYAYQCVVHRAMRGRVIVA